jgi:hypothetical protein
MVENQPDPLVSHQQLNNTLGYSLTAEEYQHCLKQVKSSRPKVGKFWQGTEAERGIYIVIAGKVRLLDEAGELITSLEARSSFGEFTLFPEAEFKPLVIRAQMPTTESGSLQEGLSVKLKFDAYPFQDYGVVEGKLVDISPTSIEADAPNGKTAAYNLEIALNQHCIPTRTKCIGLRPGETATAEVIVRQRRLIDFILDPFKKLQEGGLKL